jgi:hypothetical protein
MNPISYKLNPECDTFQAVQSASRLLKQASTLALALTERADAADAGPCPATYRRIARVENAAWARYNRRVYAYNLAADVRWGAR